MSPGPTSEEATDDASTIAPLRNTVFAVLWAATVFGNIGSALRDTTSAWLMTSLSPSATYVALVQTASTLPVFLLSLPAGALADILDRRRLMIAVQCGLAAVSAALALLAALGWMTPWALLVLTLLAGVGSALGNPIWQAIVPELVPKAQLRSAVVLNGLGINISRALGPALGGGILAVAGVGAAYAADVLTYAAVIAALVWWPRAPRPASVHPEHVGGAVRSGLRFALRHPPLLLVAARAIVFFLFGGAYLALLPLVAREGLAGGPELYGMMLGALGAGAIAGAFLVPAARRRLGPDTLVAGGSVLTAATTAMLVLASEPWQALAVLFAAGLAWIAVLTTLNATAQAILPDWVRARGLAVYLMSYFGALMISGLVFGMVATRYSVDTALMLAAGGGAATAFVALRLRLPAADLDLTPAASWPEVSALHVADPDHRPALVTISYRVRPEGRQAFDAALRDWSRIRRRDGAAAWGIYEDIDDPEHLLEWFIVPSWNEHLRQHERLGRDDRALQERLHAIHAGRSAPLVRHYVAFNGGQAPALLHAHDHGKAIDGQRSGAMDPAPL